MRNRESRRGRGGVSAVGLLVVAALVDEGTADRGDASDPKVIVPPAPRKEG